jgi:hypothetical protein
LLIPDFVNPPPRHLNRQSTGWKDQVGVAGEEHYDANPVVEMGFRFITSSFSSVYAF